jgi:hypothetical protein
VYSHLRCVGEELDKKFREVKYYEIRSTGHYGVSLVLSEHGLEDVLT